MAKGNYVDGFVIPIPKKNTAKNKKMASEGARAWKKFGALDYKQCISDDTPPMLQKGDGLLCQKVRRAWQCLST